MGRPEQDVDFLRSRLGLNGITVATATIARGVTRLHRFQEQQGRDPMEPRPWVCTCPGGGIGQRGGLPDLQPSLLLSILTRREQISDYASSNWIVST